MPLLSSLPDPWFLLGQFAQALGLLVGLLYLLCVGRHGRAGNRLFLRALARVASGLAYAVGPLTFPVGLGRFYEALALAWVGEQAPTSEPVKAP